MAVIIFFIKLFAFGLMLSWSFGSIFVFYFLSRNRLRFWLAFFLFLVLGVFCIGTNNKISLPVKRAVFVLILSVIFNFCKLLLFSFRVLSGSYAIRLGLLIKVAGLKELHSLMTSVVN